MAVHLFLCISFVDLSIVVVVMPVFRILAQFAFSLSQDWELPLKKDLSKPLKEGISDMLIKHHLFSWDI